MNALPPEITFYCENVLGRIKGFRSVSGGCINNGGRLETDTGSVFIKWNSATRFKGMFTAEQKGLTLLDAPDCIRIPKVLHCYEGTEYSCLILEWLESAIKLKDYWTILGRQLADLHRQTQANFGLDHDNFIGSLPQRNLLTEDWIPFFISQRLTPQIKMAFDQGKLESRDVQQFELLFKNLPSLLPLEKPSLTHGDLWSGNLMTDNDGLPALIDPAVSYTHREVDLAFTVLFGGFDAQFYTAYNEAFPLVSGYEKRLDIYNLYPLLVHVNLFGGGYYQQTMTTVKRFI